MLLQESACNKNESSNRNSWTSKRWKGTLFNALVGDTKAMAANFPFCTIEPNIGLINVPDKKLLKLAEINKSVKVQHAYMEFVDIAGIIKGASEGAGLGNKFLSNIRMTDAIVHLVRCFEDTKIIHVDESVDPIRDIEVINLELILADMVQVEKRLEKLVKDKAKSPHEWSALQKINEALQNGISARHIDMTSKEKESVKGLMLLSMKNIIYAANVGDNDLARGNAMSAAVGDFAVKDKSGFVLVSAQVESELALLTESDRGDFLQQLEVTEETCGLKILVREAYKSLNLQTYYTSGPTETRAWTIAKGMTAPQAAGVIHSDFEKGFIRAEIVSYNDYIACGGDKGARDRGLMRSEGKDYIMQEDDIVLFRFNV